MAEELGLGIKLNALEKRIVALEAAQSEQPEIFWSKVHPDAKAPTTAHDEDAGYDLYCVGQHIFRPGEQLVIPTGIAIQLPKGCWAEVKDRSSRAKEMFRVGGGVMDELYRGEYMVVMQNMSPNEMMFNTGDKIAQFVIQRYVKGKLIEKTKLDDTVRGAKGFGSSGSN